MRSILLLICFLFYSHVYCVDILYGSKGGLSLHKIDFLWKNDTFSVHYNYHFGPTLNGICAFNNSNIFQQQINIGYFQAGGKAKESDWYDTSGNKIGTGYNIQKYDYLNIGYFVNLILPLYFLKPYLAAGMQLDYLINYDDIMILNNKPLIMHNFCYSDLNKFNISFLIGPGVKYQFNKFDIFIESIVSKNILPFFENEAVNHYTFGYIFNLGILIKV